MKTRTFSAVAISTISLLMATSVGATTRHRHHASTHSTVNSGMKLSATLAGTSQVPAGDPDAKGIFSATLNMAHTQLCYELHVSGLSAPTAAHIHIGTVGQNGGPIVMLAAPARGMSKACVAVAADLGQKLMAMPDGYYVNVHNAEFPGGGLRGQLSK